MIRAKGHKIPLSSLIDKGLIEAGDTLIAKYKGKRYQATVVQNGIKFRGNIYPTPASAGCAVTGCKTCDGWMFWRIQDQKSRQFLRLAEVRKTISGDIRQYRKQKRKKK